MGIKEFVVLCIQNFNFVQIRTRNAGILRPNVVDVALLIFGATCQQGSTVELKGMDVKKNIGQNVSKLNNILLWQ